MTEIYITRHWQDEDNANGILNWHRDMPLTQIWLEQATQLARKIKDTNIQFDAIYSSPLQRAYKTAETISNCLSMPKPTILYQLIERNFWSMTWQKIKDIEKLCTPNILKTDTVTYFLSPEWAETFEDLFERAKELLKHIKNINKWETILLVTHWDLGKMLYTAYYELEWEDVLKKFHFWNSELLLLSEHSSADDTHVFSAIQHNH